MRTTGRRSFHVGKLAASGNGWGVTWLDTGQSAVFTDDLTRENLHIADGAVDLDDLD